MQLNTNYTAILPRTIIFGSNSRTKVPAIIDSLTDGSAKVCWVCSKSVLDSAPAKELQQALGDRLTAVFTNVPHDPPVQVVDAIRQLAADMHANCILGLGGGSVMDAAKAAAFLANVNEPTAIYLAGKCPLPSAGIPCVAMPTTAGTGAEITKNAVLSDFDANVKISLRSPAMTPAAAISDPDFTVALPPSVTAASGMDALTQAIESYTSSNASAFTQSIAIRAVTMIAQNLPAAFTNPSDMAARTALAEASLMTAVAFAQSGLGAVHGLAHPVGHILNASHGLTCAVLLPKVIQFNLDSAQSLYDDLAHACGLNAADKLPLFIDTLLDQLKLPHDFAQFGLNADHFPFIVANCRSGSMKSNPKFMSDEDAVNILNTLR